MILQYCRIENLVVGRSLGLTLLILLSSCSSGTSLSGLAALPNIPVDTCLLVDTDVAADDLRAIAILSRSRRVKAFVTTGGSTQSGVGATILKHFFVDANQPSPPIFVGSNAPLMNEAVSDRSFRDYSEHPFRKNMTMVPTPPTSDLRSAVRTVLNKCSSVALVIIGPWTNVPSYLPIANIRAVFAQGRPDLKRSDQTPVSWNCQHDPAACNGIQQHLTGTPLVWIDVSPQTNGYWALNQQMLNRLPERGLPGAVRNISAADTDRIGWRGLWDDLVALAVLRSDLFRPAGSHFEPAVDNIAISNAWVAALGG